MCATCILVCHEFGEGLSLQLWLKSANHNSGGDKLIWKQSELIWGSQQTVEDFLIKNNFLLQS